MQSTMTEWVGIVAIIGVSGGVAFLCILALGFLRLVGGRRGARHMNEDESRMLQDLWSGLQKMEARITNLETILLHRDRREK